MARRCDNPDCDNSVQSWRSRHICLGNSEFCSTKCKEEYFLWVEAVARQEPEIDVRPPEW